MSIRLLNRREIAAALVAGPVMWTAAAALKEKGALASPSDAAARILAFLDRPDFGANPQADIRG